MDRSIASYQLLVHGDPDPSGSELLEQDGIVTRQPIAELIRAGNARRELDRELRCAGSVGQPPEE
jgi:hypothetical protein